MSDISSAQNPNDEAILEYVRAIDNFRFPDFTLPGVARAFWRDLGRDGMTGRTTHPSEYHCPPNNFHLNHTTPYLGSQQQKAHTGWEFSAEAWAIAVGLSHTDQHPGIPPAPPSTPTAPSFDTRNASSYNTGKSLPMSVQDVCQQFHFYYTADRIPNAPRGGNKSLVPKDRCAPSRWDAAFRDYIDSEDRALANTVAVIAYSLAQSFNKFKRVLPVEIVVPSCTSLRYPRRFYGIISIVDQSTYYITPVIVWAHGPGSDEGPDDSRSKWRLNSNASVYQDIRGPPLSTALLDAFAGQPVMGWEDVEYVGPILRTRSKEHVPKRPRRYLTTAALNKDAKTIDPSLSLSEMTPTMQRTQGTRKASPGELSYEKLIHYRNWDRFTDLLYLERMIFLNSTPTEINFQTPQSPFSLEPFTEIDIQSISFNSRDTSRLTTIGPTPSPRTTVPEELNMRFVKELYEVEQSGCDINNVEIEEHVEDSQTQGSYDDTLPGSEGSNLGHSRQRWACELFSCFTSPVNGKPSCAFSMACPRYQKGSGSPYCQLCHRVVVYSALQWHKGNPAPRIEQSRWTQSPLLQIAANLRRKEDINPIWMSELRKLHSQFRQYTMLAYNSEFINLCLPYCPVATEVGFVSIQDLSVQLETNVEHGIAVMDLATAIADVTCARNGAVNYQRYFQRVYTTLDRRYRSLRTHGHTLTEIGEYLRDIVGVKHSTHRFVAWQASNDVWTLGRAVHGSSVSIEEKSERMLYIEGNQPEVLGSINIMSLTGHIFQLDSMRLCDAAAVLCPEHLAVYRASGRINWHMAGFDALVLAHIVRAVVEKTRHLVPEMYEA